MGALRKLTLLLRRLSLFRDGILFIPLAALIASCPRFVRGISCGHDFEFHLISWMETQRSWSQGVLYPHWAQTPNWDAGEPRFIFYPPLTWMLGASLGYLMPWVWVPATFIFLCLTAIGLSTRVLARQFLSARSATLAGVIATATPYAFFTAYERTAFSELAAASFIPLLLLFAWRQSEKRTLPSDAYSRFPALDGSTAPLALILAAIWLTNAPAGVMASYLLAFAALASALLQRQWWPILRAAVAVPIALGLAAFYLVPAAWEQSWIVIQQALDVGMRINDSWLFARHASPDLALHDQVLRTASMLFAFTVAFALAAFIFIRRKLPPQNRRIWLPLALLIPILLLLQLSISAPIWNLLPKLQFLQFPWRWLMVLDIPFAIFLAAATPLGTRRSRLWSAFGWTAVLLLFTGAATRLFVQPCDNEDQVSNQIAVFHANTGVEGTDEYAAVGSDNSQIPSDLPDGCLVSDPTRDIGENSSGPTPDWWPELGTCDGIYTAQLSQNEHKLLQINSDHDGFVVLRLDRYPAWQITVNHKPVTSLPAREDGLITVPVSAGPSTIEVRWTTTPDVRWGRWISLGSLFLLTTLWLVEQRGRRVRLS